VPSKGEQDLCRTWLEQELALVQPEIVVPVGGLAVSLLLGMRPLNRVVGFRLERPDDDPVLTPWARKHVPAAAKIVPLPHPSGASLWLNRPENQELVGKAIQILAHLRGDASGEPGVW
jgi:uracil-DNA glycosylase